MPVPARNPIFVLLLFALLSAGCTREPKVEFAVNLNPYGKTPLAAEAVFNSSLPVVLKGIEIEGGRSSTFEGRKKARQHRLAVVGFRPATTHQVKLSYQLATGEMRQTESVKVVTPPLPRDFPQIEVSKSGSDQELEGGYLLLGLSPLEEGEPLAQTGIAILLDSEGEVVWYLKTESSIGAMVRLENGNLMFQQFRSLRLQEIDWLGQVQATWQSSGLRSLSPGDVELELDSMHHDFQVVGNKFWTLASELDEQRRVDDLVVCFDREGNVSKSLSLIGLLDPDRELYPRFPNFWEFFYGRGVRDWGHVNSLELDSTSETALLSVSHQDAIVKIDLEPPKVRWILGRPEGWGEAYADLVLKAKGPLSWPARQHSASTTKEGTILCFDNGRKQSRAVEYRVNEQAGEVEQVWEFVDEPPFFSELLSDVRQLPKTGNVQITDGARRGGPFEHWARVVEVSHTTPPRKLLEISFRRLGTRGCSIYRCVRLPDLYPR